MKLKLKKLDITQILSVISIPILGYISAYFYLYGKYTYLNIPIYLIEVNIDLAIFSTFLSLISLIVLLAMGLAIYIGFKFPVKKNPELDNISIKKGDFWTTLLVVLIFLSLVSFFILKINNLSNLIKILLLILTNVSLSLVAFLPPILEFSEVKGYINKFDSYSEKVYKERLAKAKQEKNVKFDISKIFLFLQSFLPLNYFFYFIFFFCWILLAIIIGYGEIPSQHNMPIINSKSNNFILAGKYNGNLILVPIDLKKKSILKKIILKPNNEEVEIQQVEIGKLIN